MKTPRICVVEDDESTLFGYQQYLIEAGFSVSTAASLLAAKKLVALEEFDGILLDNQLPDGNSLDWIEELRKEFGSLSIIVITGSGDIATAVRAMQLGADDFLAKPVRLEVLAVSLQKSLELGGFRKQNIIRQKLAEKETGFFGTSQKMVEIMDLARVAAESETDVVLFGETGTGKGVLAKWIHNHSSRKAGAFVELNCSTLKGDLLRSELYGHTRGAFTSALKDREGLVEAADGGTLFLDEIGDMGIEVQAQLLKTLEEKTFRRIGENRLRTSDFRLICATNSDLAKAQDDGTFRKDLYYRICVFPITLPALHERKEDIPGLAEHLLKQAGYAYPHLSTAVLEFLTNYPWDGNIRELRNILERAGLLARRKELTLHHFPSLTDAALLQAEISVNWKIEEFELMHIHKALDYYGGDKNRACEALGLSLSALYRRLEKAPKGPKD